MSTTRFEQQQQNPSHSSSLHRNNRFQPSINTIKKFQSLFRKKKRDDIIYQFILSKHHRLLSTSSRTAETLDYSQNKYLIEIHTKTSKTSNRKCFVFHCVTVFVFKKRQEHWHPTWMTSMCNGRQKNERLFFDALIIK